MSTMSFDVNKYLLDLQPLSNGSVLHRYLVLLLLFNLTLSRYCVDEPIDSLITYFVATHYFIGNCMVLNSIAPQVSFQLSLPPKRLNLSNLTLILKKKKDLKNFVEFVRVD